MEGDGVNASPYVNGWLLDCAFGGGVESVLGRLAFDLYIAVGVDVDIDQPSTLIHRADRIPSNLACVVHDLDSRQGCRFRAATRGAYNLIMDKLKFATVGQGVSIVVHVLFLAITDHRVAWLLVDNPRDCVLVQVKP